MDIKDAFFTLSSGLNQILIADEILLCTLQGEQTDFVRFNHSQIRQAGSVNQYEFGLQLINGQRHSSATSTISGHHETDLDQLKKLLLSQREQNQQIPDDPFLNYSTTPENTDFNSESELPESEQVIEHLFSSGPSLDQVGIFANGALHQGFANSLGQQNWQTQHQFNLDWSCYLKTDKAVKTRYAGSKWDHDLFNAKFESIRQQLDLLNSPAISIKPGQYRCYLSPTALSSILEIAAWGGFGLKSHHTKSSPLIKLNEQEIQLNKSVHLSENHAKGFTPAFTPQGFIKPDEVILIDKGTRANYLVSARTAKEFGNSVNAQAESTQSLHLAAGQLPSTDILQAIDTGLLINNLWYTNFSDRVNCRITGMTRFACFYVENGIIQAPINVMRFDQSLYEILGEKLVNLTQDAECLASTDTYYRRSSSSMTLPGIVVDGFNLSF